MPAKDVARLLNNESNLKILDRLKVRPYYPRELAQEMELSEPFVVRRLKAMEEEGIVEGRWEAEGSRKVKRYYLQDVKIEYGKEGLKVSSEEIPEKPGIDLKNEMIGRLIKLPLIIIFGIGVLFNILALQVALLAFLLWYVAMTTGFYNRYHFKTTLLAIPLYTFNTLVIGGLVAGNLLHMPVPLDVVIGLLAAGLVFIMIYHARYYQLELGDLLIKNREFIDGLEDSPLHVKLFYLPMAVRWKLCEYFKIV
ncbi:ArsR/SmtB family transcription factor [Methanocella sp. MCL-LM]|uniref:ArsR/SmtB family transcription factor n=1 Tax=Methanocella sp. MCL-LM TaxID=3412035 RepID=UPI003C7263AE